MNAEPDDDAMQGNRYDDRFEHQRDRGSNVEMRRVLNEGLPSHRGGQHQGVQGIEVEERIEAVPVELEEADQNQRYGNPIRQIESKTLHPKHPHTNPTTVPQR